MFLEMNRLETVVKEGNMIGRRKDIVHGEPHRPGCSSQPAVPGEPPAGILPRNIKIYRANLATLTKHRCGVLDSAEPIRDHGKRIRERDDIHGSFGGRLQAQVGPSRQEPAAARV